MHAFTAADAFNAFIFPQKSQEGIDYLKNQFNRFTGPLTNTANEFIQRSRERIEQLNSSAAIEFARNMIKSVMGSAEVTTDRITSLWEINQFQGASLQMQRWVMANPTVREYYHEQRCDGYSESYVDTQPKLRGEDHYDYRRVMEGMIQYDEQGDWFARIYFEDLIEGDRDLTHGEKTDIIYTWSKLEYLMALGKDDPTSPEGGFL